VKAAEIVQQPKTKKTKRNYYVAQTSGHTPRLKNKLIQQGMTYHELEDCIYWDEKHVMNFMPKTLTVLKPRRRNCMSCVCSSEYVIQNDLFPLFRIPEN